MGKDYYKILEISRSASASEVRSAYLKLAKKWHPDLKRGTEEKEAAKERFQDVSEAFEVLSHATRRKIYDRGGEEALTAGGKRTTTGVTENKGIPPNSANRLAAQFFGYGIQGLDPVEGRPLGGNNVPTKKGIPGFNLSGFKEGKTVTSSNGMQTTTYSRAPKSVAKKSTKRPVVLPLECTLEELFNGAEKTVEWNAYENGEHIVKEVEITVKPGWTVGHKIDVEDDHDEVMIIVTEKAHPLFTRKKEDLFHDCNVTLAQALCGDDIVVPTIGDKNLKLRFGGTVHSGQTHEILGHGMPVKNSDSRGKLIVTFHVQLPAKLTAEQKKGLLEIL